MRQIIAAFSPWTWPTNSDVSLMDFPCVVVGRVEAPAYHQGESASFKPKFKNVAAVEMVVKDPIQAEQVFRWIASHFAAPTIVAGNDQCAAMAALATWHSHTPAMRLIDVLRIPDSHGVSHGTHSSQSRAGTP
jgi:hypothetical protein